MFVVEGGGDLDDVHEARERVGRVAHEHGLLAWFEGNISKTPRNLTNRSIKSRTLKKAYVE